MDENKKKSIMPRLEQPSPTQDVNDIPSEQAIAHGQEVYGKSMRTIQPLTPGLQAPEQAVPHPALDAVSAIPTEADPPRTQPQPASTNATTNNIPTSTPSEQPKRSVYPIPHEHGEGFGPSASPPSLSIPDSADDINASGYSRASQTLVVFLLAAGAGALFFKLFELALRHLPQSVFACSLSSTLAGTPCNRFWLAIFCISALLFSLVSYLSFLIRQRSFALAFGAASFAVSLFVYLELSAALNFFGLHIMEWLVSHHTLNIWVVPAVIAGVVAAAVCLISTYLAAKARMIAGGVFGIIAVASLFFTPGLAHRAYIAQAQVAVQDYKAKRLERIVNSPVPLYAPKNYSGPLKLIRAHDSASVSAAAAPYFSISYALASADPEPNNVTVVIYKGADVHFSPPDDCGDNAPWMPSRTHPTACKNVLTTANGRKVYTDTYGLQNNRPNQYYISMGQYVVGLSDFNRPRQQVSPLTLQLVGQFADSLEPLTGSELVQFVNKYFIL